MPDTVGRKRKQETADAVCGIRAATRADAQAGSSGGRVGECIPLSWSHYVSLMAVEKPQARAFYETEAIRGGWSVRQLDRQIGTQFYERAVRSKHPQALLARGRTPQIADALSAEEEIRDPYLLEFLNLKDEYSENDLEEALIRHME